MNGEVMAPQSAPLGSLKRLGLLAVVMLPIVAAMHVEFPLCPSAAFFGIPCPGCGLTRATLALGNGQLAEALALHPLVVVVAPIYGWLAVAAVWGFVRGSGAGPGASAAVAAPEHKARALRFDRALTWMATVLVALLVLLWAARFFGAFGGPVPVTTFQEWRANKPSE